MSVRNTGMDQNSGRSSAEPYASLFAINRLKLQPGDRILLENNSVFARTVFTDYGQRDEGFTDCDRCI